MTADVQIQIDRLQGEVDDLRSMLESCLEAMEPFGVPPSAKLPRRCGDLIRFIRKRSPQIVSKDAAMIWLYGGTGNDYPDDKIIGIYVHLARKKLKPLNIKITTHWGVGFSMKSADARRWDIACGVQLADPGNGTAGEVSRFTGRC